MGDKDLISRRAVLTNVGDLITLYSATGRITEWDLETFEKIIKNLSPAPREMTAREYITIEQRCKSWCVSNCASDGGCESCCYHGFCWADAIEPEEYLRFYTLWAKEHPERSEK